MDAMEGVPLDPDKSYKKLDCNVQVCRVCLLSAIEMRYLFENEVKSLSAKVMSLTSLKMTPDDGLPQKVCCGCAVKLENAYEFKLQAEEADKVLRSKIGIMGDKEQFFGEVGVSAEADSDNEMDDSFEDMDDNNTEQNPVTENFEKVQPDFQRIECIQQEDDQDFRNDKGRTNNTILSDNEMDEIKMDDSFEDMDDNNTEQNPVTENFEKVQPEFQRIECIQQEDDQDFRNDKGRTNNTILSDNEMDEIKMDDSFEDMDDNNTEQNPVTENFEKVQPEFQRIECIQQEDDQDFRNGQEKQSLDVFASSSQPNRISEETKQLYEVNPLEGGNTNEAKNLTNELEEHSDACEQEDPFAGTDSLPCEAISIEHDNNQKAANISQESTLTVKSTAPSDQDSDEENYFKHLNLRSRSKKIPSENSESDKVFFMCYLCDKQFLSKSILKEHMYSHEEIRRTLTRKGTLESKKLVVPSTETTPTPISGTPSKAKIYEQNPIPSGKKSNKCPHCGKEYLYISSYTKHLKQHDSDKDIEKDDPMPLEILFHEDESSLDFENCNRSNKKKSKVDDKLQEKKDADAAAMDADDFKLDERIEEIVMYLCKMCEEKILVKRDLMIHLLTHDISLKCKICLKEFNSFDSWTTHCSEYHQEGKLSSDNNKGNDDSQRESLEKCKEDDGFSLLDASENNNWTEVRELKCPECPMTYSHRRSAARHFETHLGKKHPCEICGLGFTRKDHLQRHMETHTGTKYHCTVCNKEFTRKDHLQRHLKQHPKVVSYRCTQCNKSFGNKLTLKNHLKVANHKTTSFEPDFESNTRSKRSAAKAAKEFIDLISVELQSDSLYDDDDDELWTASGEGYNRKEEPKVKKSNAKNESAGTTKNSSTLQTAINRKRQMKHKTTENNKNSPIETNKDECKIDKEDDDDNSDYESGIDTSMNTYECLTCKKSYSTKKSLMRHQLVHEEPNYQCDICGLKIYRKDKFNEHYEKCCGKNPDKVTKCNICGDSFENNDLLRDHKATHVTEGVLSEEDLKIEPNPADKTPGTKVARKRRTDIVGLKCPECNKQYNTRKNLLRHIQVHNDKKFLCDVCPKKFFRREHLKVHLAKHNIVKPYACEICPKRFVKEDQLANHMTRHDGLPRKSKNPNGKRYLCEICSKTFTQSTTLVAHLRAHKGIKPYVCTYCNRPFTTKAYLRMHLRTHTQERPYVCQYCSKAFARADTLANHITQHTGEAKYKCKFCQKNFRRLKNLKEHIFIHTGQRPYACPTCDRRFSNNGSRYAHRKKCQQMYGQRQNHAETLTEEEFRQHLHERAHHTFTQL